MTYTDLIFDLYGTLVDIHTEEDDTVWEKTAIYFGFYGAHYTGPELKQAFQNAMQQRASPTSASRTSPLSRSWPSCSGRRA